MTQSVLVTGTSTGFGMEIALYLAERGFQVYASMRDLNRRAELDAAAARRNVTPRVIELDVTDQASIDAAVRTVVAETGGIYGVVNNAGQFLRGFFEDLDDAEIRQVFETNLFGVMAVTRAALPHMRAARAGRIVIISSVAGKIGAPSGSAYSASRFAQEGFAEALSQEVEPLGVRVVLIEPGITKTESWTVDRGVAARARNPNSPYYEWFNRAEHLFDRAMQSSPIMTEDVARTVHTALTARRPRMRYIVGRRAGLVVALRRYLPGELFERLYFGEVMRRVTGARRSDGRV
jgi:NAD(P)-dependent dehydrogenase (short-subunit alcohol dehydrogenase family)